MFFLTMALTAHAQDTHVVLLGTGTPNPEPERMGPAVAVVSAGRVYLVDAGPGVVRRAAQACHHAFHTLASDLGRVAAAVQPKQLVLYHQLPTNHPPEEIIAEIREHFAGAIHWGRDLDVVR